MGFGGAEDDMAELEHIGRGGGGASRFGPAPEEGAEDAMVPAEPGDDEAGFGIAEPLDAEGLVGFHRAMIGGLGAESMKNPRFPVGPGLGQTRRP